MSNENMFQLLIDTFRERWTDIFEALQQHLFLSLVSILIATLISVPTGIFIARRRKIAEPIIGIASVFQTVPSLALFGFLLPFLGLAMSQQSLR